MIKALLSEFLWLWGDGWGGVGDGMGWGVDWGGVGAGYGYYYEQKFRKDKFSFV